jgi:hypothetical protein
LLDERAARPRRSLTPLWLRVAIVALHGGLHGPAPAGLQRSRHGISGVMSRVGEKSAPRPILCSRRRQMSQRALLASHGGLSPVVHAGPCRERWTVTSTMVS